MKLELAYGKPKAIIDPPIWVPFEFLILLVGINNFPSAIEGPTGPIEAFTFFLQISSPLFLSNARMTPVLVFPSNGMNPANRI